MSRHDRRNPAAFLAASDREPAFNGPLPDALLAACPGCDLLQRLPEPSPGASEYCARCDTELRRGREDSLDRTLALTFAAAILYVVANSVPMLGLTIAGLKASTTIAGGAKHLWDGGRETVAALVLLTAVIAPAIQIGFMLTIAMGARRERPQRWVGALMRFWPMARTWSMLEVLLLGVLVALTKIADYATVVPGMALFLLAALVFILPAIQVSFDAQDVWNRIEWVNPGSGDNSDGSVGAQA